ncbi:MAG TPA: 50S ribosomal protein L30 [Anaerolineae bacterium]
MEKTLRVTWRKSAIGYNKKQKATLAALGFKKLGETREMSDNAAVRGMIAKVTHLVTVEDK